MGSRPCSRKRCSSSHREAWLMSCAGAWPGWAGDSGSEATAPALPCRPRCRCELMTSPPPTKVSMNRYRKLGMSRPRPCSSSATQAAEGAQAVEQLVQVRADRRQQHVDVREGVVEHDALAHMAGEVHQQPVGTAAADLDADGKGAVGVETNGHRRLAHTAAHRGFAAQQLVFIEPRSDEPDGL